MDGIGILSTICHCRAVIQGLWLLYPPPSLSGFSPYMAHHLHVTFRCTQKPKSDHPRSKILGCKVKFSNVSLVGNSWMSDSSKLIRFLHLEVILMRQTYYCVVSAKNIERYEPGSKTYLKILFVSETNLMCATLIFIHLVNSSRTAKATSYSDTRLIVQSTRNSESVENFLMRCFQIFNFC